MKVISKVQAAFLFTSTLATIAGAHAMEKPKAVSATTSLAGKTSPPAQREEMVPGLMIKPRARGGEKIAAALANHDSAELSRIAGAKLSVFRKMSGGAHVMRLARPVPLSEARAMAVRLMQEGSFEMAESDRIVRPLLLPNDPLYAQSSQFPAYQWHYHAPTSTNLGGANLPDAWDITRGGPSVVVAVLDTGILTHEDIADGAVLPGYDFINNFTNKSRPRANDGDARDTSPRDPGDFATSEDFCYDSTTLKLNNSSWHGTHVAGTIIASMNNRIGGTGIAPNVKMLPMRVLGTCGGVFSDIIDGMRWAAGIPNQNLPVNSTPAKVLNMSLGGAPGPCSPAFQSAVDDVVSAGAVVIAASGNENAIGVLQPANCSGVVAVTAHSIDADTTTYANIGFETALSAPGGGCGETNFINGQCTVEGGERILSTVNSGKTTPESDAYGTYAGTSMGVPHVSGVVALMLSRNAAQSPLQLKSYLQSSTRLHPATSACVTRPLYAGRCGAGLLDGTLALQTVAALPPYFTSVTKNLVVAPGTTVALDASAIDPNGAVTAYEWTQSGGELVTLNNANSQNASFAVPPVGVVSLKVRVTDNTGESSTADVVVRVNSLPAAAPSPTQTVLVDQPVALTLTANDADNDPVIFAPISLPEGATLNPKGEFSWAKASPAGSYTVTYAVADFDGSTQGSFTIDVAQPARSGGGGSMEGGVLIALAAMAAARRVRRASKSTEHARGR